MPTCGRAALSCTYAEYTQEHFVQNRSKCWTRSQGDPECAFLENAYDPDTSDTTFEGYLRLPDPEEQGRVHTET